MLESNHRQEVERILKEHIVKVENSVLYNEQSGYTKESNFKKCDINKVVGIESLNLLINFKQSVDKILCT